MSVSEDLQAKEAAQRCRGDSEIDLSEAKSMEWHENKCSFVNDFSQYLLKFISDRVKIAGQSNSDQWRLFFQQVESWKNQCFISSEAVEIYGVNGWYVDLEFSRFQCLDSTVFQKEEYVAVLLFIDLLNSCDGDVSEYKCIENTEFEEYFYTYYDFLAEECAVLSNLQFCDELQHLYDSSFERFQHYVHQSVSKNQKVIENLKKQYPVFQSYLDFFEYNLDENSDIIRLNSFGCDEDVWYIVSIDVTVFLISVKEII